MGKRIDPHVHCRDWGQSYKATIKSVTEIARRQGVVAIIDMPNTQPAITSEELVMRRLSTAESEGCLDGYYLYVGATRSPEQLKEAVRLVRDNPKVLGIKMYAGRSVGDLEVPDEEGQRAVYRALAGAGYTGPVMLHCEKESLFRMDLWDPKRPHTWLMARPPEAEVESVRDQIRLAIDSGLEAHLHICHISVPEAVELVNDARRELDISCGATPHHLTMSTDDMKTRDGITYKVNPPLRDRETAAGLMDLLKHGRIDWIETDHAPHTEDEKARSYLSGIQSLGTYSSFLEGLREDGFTDAQIERLTYSNIKRVFPKIIE
ncbi:MAG: dihydroorotase [Candidatus Micrarchaeota archaeon]|nr:dihydroorotase [Candidatus Micrarchaeota archaeon]